MKHLSLKMKILIVALIVTYAVGYYIGTHPSYMF